ncbi:hypothetical protein MKX03_037342 [Papaver bracteatum]|nr:hypothetical protein MKX03_037342 [Papaver bracteatum]
MESLTRRKARPTIFFILCLLVIFKLVTTFNSVAGSLGRAAEIKYPIRSPRSNLLRVNFAPEEPGLPPIVLRIPAPPPPRPLLHHVFPGY